MLGRRRHRFFFQFGTMFPLPVPSPRRQRSVSCSDNVLDISTGEDMSVDGQNHQGSPSGPMPDVIVTRRSRTDSVCGRILEEEESGVVKYFCKSRGHGFVSPAAGGEDLFVHISDVESEFVPKSGDRVSYRLCPIPPKFDRFQVRVFLLQKQSPSFYKRTIAFSSSCAGRARSHRVFCGRRRESAAVGDAGDAGRVGIGPQYQGPALRRVKDSAFASHNVLIHMSVDICTLSYTYTFCACGRERLHV